ncbi:hypothetical protein [Mucilaginibacter antarcticus]
MAAYVIALLINGEVGRFMQKVGAPHTGNTGADDGYTLACAPNP